MRTRLVSTMIVFLLLLSLSLMYTSNVKSAQRPTWIPSGWVQLTTSANPEMEPSWSPDGGEIVYRAYDGAWDRDIWVMKADGTNKRQLTNQGVTEHPKVSPDGTKIAMSQYEGGDYFSLALMNYDGTNFHKIYTTGSCQWPSWSPKEDRIVFHSTMNGPSPPWQIFTVKSDGTDPVQLTTNGSNSWPSWSPDGSKIAFTSDRDGQYETYLMNTDGSGQVRLTTVGARRAEWSPDGRWVSFLSEYEGQLDLYMMKTDGKNIVRLTNTPGDEDAGHEWSHDGKWIAVSEKVGEDWDIYLIRAWTSEQSTPRQMTLDPADDYEPAILQDSNGKIWLIWARNTPNTSGNLWFRTSSDGGATWSDPAILIPDIQLCSGTSIYQDSTGRIWVAWGSGFYSPRVDWDIFYVTSDDGGETWSTRHQLTDYSGDDNVPCIIEVAGEVWIVFRSWGLSGDEQIWYRKSGDGGQTWSNPVQVSVGSSNYNPCAMVESTGRIWVDYTRTGILGDRVFYRTSLDNGASWSQEKELPTQPNSDGHPLSLCEDSFGRIFLFYTVIEDKTSIWYVTTDDGGNTWSGYQELAPGWYNSEFPCARLVDGQLWVAWTSDKSGNREIYLSMEHALQLPRLHTDGRHIKDEQGNEVHLYGVNKPGLEWSWIMDYDGDGVREARIFNENDDSEYHDVGWVVDDQVYVKEDDWKIIRSWGCNVVRLGFQQEWWEESEEYRQIIDKSIETAEKYGMYTILENHWTNNRTQQNTGHPEDWTSWKQMWSLIAQRYKDRTSVLFDIWNEPHHISDAEWRNEAQDCVNFIRNTGNDAIILISSTDWGHGGIWWALDNPITGGNITYTLHWYKDDTLFSPSGIDGIKLWLYVRGWLKILSFAPVITGEFNVASEAAALGSQETWMRNFCSVMDDWDIHFLGWGWYPEEWRKPPPWQFALLRANGVKWDIPSKGGEILIEEIARAKLNDEVGGSLSIGPVLSVAAHSPLNIMVTSPTGARVGYDPVSGSIVNEIDGAAYFGPATEPQVIAIPDPTNDAYSIVLVGTTTGDYTLTIGYFTFEQTATKTFSGTISKQEKQYYSAAMSETGEMTAISWEHVFTDPERSTILKISTDDKYFQFVAPGKDFGMKQNPKMKLTDNGRAIFICFKDTELTLLTVAVDTKLDLCVVYARDVLTGNLYYLWDKPGIE